MLRPPSLVVVALILISLSSPSFAHDLHSFDPVSSKDSIFTFLDVGTRITLLTSNLLRLESIDPSSGISFEDRASLAFNNRNLPSPPNTSALSSDKVLTIELEGITVTYDTTKSLSSESFSVVSTDDSSAFESWTYGDANKNQLPGTIR